MVLRVNGSGTIAYLGPYGYVGPCPLYDTYNSSLMIIIIILCDVKVGKIGCVVSYPSAYS